MEDTALSSTTPEIIPSPQEGQEQSDKEKIKEEVEEATTPTPIQKKTPTLKKGGHYYYIVDGAIKNIELNDEWFTEHKNFRWAQRMPYQDFTRNIFDEHVINNGLPIVLTDTLMAWDPSHENDDMFSLQWLKENHGYSLLFC